MPKSQITHTGGCLCGDVQYEVTGEPSVVTICHCRMCQRQTGSPFAFVAKFHADAVVWNKEPVFFKSSARASRSFCPKCGSSLSFQEEDGTVCWFFLGSMDNPKKFTPSRQYHLNGALTWIHQIDDIPRHDSEFDYKN